MAESTAQLGSAASSGIGEVLVSCRSFDEYRAMFALTDQDLALALLDCPGGAAGFTAAAAAEGAHVQACDPLYGSEPERLVARAAADRRRAERYVREHPDEYAWTFFAGIPDYRAQPGAALAVFARDYETHRDRYVQASLPVLPFGDDAFDLVLSSHRLFAFADRLDLDFHLAAITEMMRGLAGRADLSGVRDGFGPAPRPLTASSRTGSPRDQHATRRGRLRVSARRTGDARVSPHTNVVRPT